MADQSAAVSGYGALVWHPGNPELPTLPGVNDPSVGKLDEFAVGADKPFISDRGRVPAPPTGQSAAPAVGFADWYLNQIWATPVPVDFGDIADQKDVELTLYSTYRDQRSIDSIEIPVDNVDIVSGVSPVTPITLDSFSDEILTFRADQAGPDQFDDDITFTFDLGTFTVRTLGRRVLLMFSAAENGLTEQLVFATDLMRAKNGTEQSFSLRKAPFSTLQYRFRLSDLNDAKRTELETILFGGAPVLPIGVQHWFEARKVTAAAAPTDLTVNIDTANMQIAVGDTFVFTTPSNTNFFGTIDSFTANDITFEQAIGGTIPLDSYGMPVRFGHLEGVNIRTFRENLEDIIVKVRTEGEADWSNLDTTYFDLHPSESPGRPILKERCVQRNVIGGTIDREEERLDSITGRLFVTGTEPLGEWSTNVFVWVNSLADLWAWRTFLHYVRGSWGTFYLPTFQNDLPLNADFALGGNTFDIPFMNIAGLLGGAAPKRDLRIVTDDGSIYYRRISSIVDNGNGTETVTLDATVGSVGSSAIADTRISWMHLVRIDGDVAKINHTFLGQAELSFRVRTVKE